MKTLNKNVSKFKIVAPRPVWTCDVTDIPVADDTANTSEQSQRTETYQGSSDMYVVTVHSTMNDIQVEVKDVYGNDIDDFDITDIEYIK